MACLNIPLIWFVLFSSSEMCTLLNFMLNHPAFGCNTHFFQAVPVLSAITLIGVQQQWIIWAGCKQDSMREVCADFRSLSAHSGFVFCAIRDWLHLQTSQPTSRYMNVWNTWGRRKEHHSEKKIPWHSWRVINMCVKDILKLNNLGCHFHTHVGISWRRIVMSMGTMMS